MQSKWEKPRNAKLMQYSRVRNKHRGTFIIFEKNERKMKNDRNALIDVKMN